MVAPGSSSEHVVYTPDVRLGVDEGPSTLVEGPTRGAGRKGFVARGHVQPVDGARVKYPGLGEREGIDKDWSRNDGCLSQVLLPRPTTSCPITMVRHLFKETTQLQTLIILFIHTQYLPFTAVVALSCVHAHTHLVTHIFTVHPLRPRIMKLPSRRRLLIADQRGKVLRLVKHKDLVTDDDDDDDGKKHSLNGEAGSVGPKGRGRSKGGSEHDRSHGDKFAIFNSETDEEIQCAGDFTAVAEEIPFRSVLNCAKIFPEFVGRRYDADWIRDQSAEAFVRQYLDKRKQQSGARKSQSSQTRKQSAVPSCASTDDDLQEMLALSERLPLPNLNAPTGRYVNLEDLIEEQYRRDAKCVETTGAINDKFVTPKDIHPREVNNDRVLRQLQRELLPPSYQDILDDNEALNLFYENIDLKHLLQDRLRIQDEGVTLYKFPDKSVLYPERQEVAQVPESPTPRFGFDSPDLGNRRSIATGRTRASDRQSSAIRRGNPAHKRLPAGTVRRRGWSQLSNIGNLQKIYTFGVGVDFREVGNIAEKRVHGSSGDLFTDTSTYRKLLRLRVMEEDENKHEIKTDPLVFYNPLVRMQYGKELEDLLSSFRGSENVGLVETRYTWDGWERVLGPPRRQLVRNLRLPTREDLFHRLYPPPPEMDHPTLATQGPAETMQTQTIGKYEMLKI